MWERRQEPGKGQRKVEDEWRREDKVGEGTKGTEEEAKERDREQRVADGQGSPKVKWGRLGKREMPPFLPPPSFISLVVP